MKDLDSNPTRGIDLPAKIPSSSFNGEYFLLAIGINRYKHHRQLYNAVTDAKAFVNILTKQYQFSEDNAIQVYNEEATQDNILKMLNRYIDVVQEHDCLVVYFSGHGQYRKQSDEGFWIPYDGEPHKEGSWVSNDTIVNKISAIKSHHTLVIVDSCFAGALFEARKRANAKAALDKIPSRWLFTSGRYEEVPDGKAGMHSPFAENLLYFLKHNEASHLSITQLVDHVTEATLANSPQQPRGEPLQNVGHKGGQFYFYKKGVVPDESRQIANQASPSVPIRPTTNGINRQQLLIGSISLGGLVFILIWILPMLNGNIPYSEEGKNLKEIVDSTQSQPNEAKDTQNTNSILSTIEEENDATKKEAPKEQDSSQKPKKVKNLFDSSDEFQEFCGAAINGLICAKYNDHWGYVKRKQDGQLQMVIPFKFEEAHPFTGRYALVKHNKRYGWINTKGKPHISNDYLKIGIAQNGKPDNIINGARVMNANHKWGIINTTKKIVLPLEYDSISTFDEDNIAIVKQDGAFGFVNRSGRLLAGGCNYEAVEKNSGGNAKAKLFGEGWIIIELE